MIIELAEIAALVRRVRAHQKAEHAANDGRSLDSFPATRFIHNNPHLLLAAGYDEYRLVDRCEADAKDINKRFFRASFPLGREAIFRELRTGAWHLFQGFRLPSSDRLANLTQKHKNDKSLRIVFDDGRFISEYTTEDLISNLHKAANSPIERTSVLSFSSLWSPSKARANDSQIIETTRSLIENVKNEGETLESIGWRDLEEIVAELLRSKGMAVNVTPRSHDGGRDIIARGELFGEPITFAVEVKQKHTVPVTDLRSALYANRHLPVTMLVTSGRFSSGVIAEKVREENHLRLILKDGVALRQWLRTYPN